MGVAYIPPLNEGERLVVTFTITGAVSADQAAKWKQKVEELRALGFKVEIVTIRAEPIRAGGSAR